MGFYSLRFEAGGFKFEGTPLEHQVLPEEWLKDWTQNLTTILSYLKVTHPPLLAFAGRQDCTHLTASGAGRDNSAAKSSHANVRRITGI